MLVCCLLSWQCDLAGRLMKGRLQALAGANDILTDANWAGADFDTLARQKLAPYLSKDDSRLQLNGPSVVLHPEMGTSLGLVLHELATNATKYGALSAPAGSVSPTWRVDNTNPAIK